MTAPNVSIKKVSFLNKRLYNILEPHQLRDPSHMGALMDLVSEMCGPAGDSIPNCTFPIQNLPIAFAQKKNFVKKHRLPGFFFTESKFSLEPKVKKKFESKIFNNFEKPENLDFSKLFSEKMFPNVRTTLDREG